MCDLDVSFTFHFRKKRFTESTVIFLQNGVLILNWKENKESGAICHHHWEMGLMWSCLLFEEKLSNHATHLHILELCFYKKNRTQFPVYCQCTQYWVHHGVAPNKKKFVTFHFPAQQLQKKAQKIMKITFFQKSIRKPCLFV